MSTRRPNTGSLKHLSILQTSVNAWMPREVSTGRQGCWGQRRLGGALRGSEGALRGSEGALWGR